MEPNVQGRSWCFTLNNYTAGEIEDLTHLDCKYILFGKEVGAEGTPHLQGYIHFQTNKRFNAVKKLVPRAHLELAKGDYAANRAYCTKQDKEPFEKGQPPKTKKESGSAGGAITKRKYEEAYELAKKNKLDEVEPEMMVRYHGALQAIARDNMVSPGAIDALDNEWHYGPTGTGKSRGVWEKYPGAYRKPCNKWWDGYNNEEVVIIDDFDKDHKVLAHHLKIWGDHYPFIAEKKGGAMMIRPKKIIITSNYSPEDIFLFEPGSRDPIERRFKLIKY